MSDLTPEVVENQTLDTEAPNTEAPASEAAPAAEAAKPGLVEQLKEKAAKGVAPALEQTPAPVAPAYKADYKFRANNKEHEIPEFLRQALKDPESEKFVKKLFERSYGFDGVQQRFKETREAYQEIQQTHQSVMSQINDAREAYKSGDMDAVFETLKIAPEKVLQWAYNQVKLSQLPPEQRQLHEDRVAAQRRAKELEKEHSVAQEQTMQGQGEIFKEMLDMALERPNVAATAQAYNERVGKPEAFRELVIKIGRSETAISGKVLTPLQAVQQALELLGEQAPAAKPAVQAAAPVQQATPATQTPAKKVIPNLAQAGGKSNTAPAKPKYRSLDDLKRRADEISGNT